MSTPAAEDPHEERPDKRRRVYTAEERGYIDPYKEEYLKAQNKDQRRNVAITKILVPLFTYWKTQGKKRTLEKESAVRTVLNGTYERYR